MTARLRKSRKLRGSFSCGGGRIEKIENILEVEDLLVVLLI